jgi:hypothetical protein
VNRPSRTNYLSPGRINVEARQIKPLQEVTIHMATLICLYG